MNILEDSTEESNCTTCMQCDQRIINYSNQLCRRQFLPPSQINVIKTSGSFKLDEFIKETQLNSKHCDDLLSGYQVQI